VSGVLEPELAFAHEIADRAAEIGMGFFRGEFEVRKKADLTPVTEADLEIEAMVRDRVADRFPNDAVHGEEGGLRGSKTAARTWIVDPIDGTRNFAAGVQIWATLLALAVQNELVLGLVCAPGLGERYDAIRGKGARLNGRAIHVSDVAEVADSQIAFGGIDHWLGGSRERAFLKLLSDADRNRGVGDFWGHVLVARGAVDIMIEPQLRLWDYAAPSVIVQEAGGRVTQVDGSPLADGGSVLSTNGAIHEEVVTRLRSV
jgi:histidinol-phosphatase